GGPVWPARNTHLDAHLPLTVDAVSQGFFGGFVTGARARDRGRARGGVARAAAATRGAGSARAGRREVRAVRLPEAVAVEGPPLLHRGRRAARRVAVGEDVDVDGGAAAGDRGRRGLARVRERVRGADLLDPAVAAERVGPEDAAALELGA